MGSLHLTRRMNESNQSFLVAETKRRYDQSNPELRKEHGGTVCRRISPADFHSFTSSAQAK